MSTLAKAARTTPLPKVAGAALISGAMINVMN